MVTDQPKWKCVAQIGDVDPVHGAAFVFVDTTGVYDPELEVIEDNGDGNFTVSRVVLEPHTYENGVLSDNEFHKDQHVWYGVKVDQHYPTGHLGAVADYCGDPVEDLIAKLISDDPFERGYVFYYCLIAYFGAYEFDQYSQILSERAMIKRTRPYIAAIKRAEAKLAKQRSGLNAIYVQS